MEHTTNYGFNLPSKADYAKIPEHINPNFEKIDEALWGLGSGVYVGPEAPVDREDMWVDTDENSPALPLATEYQDGIMSSEDKTKLDNILDDTLTVEGKAADAKTVGDKLDTKFNSADMADYVIEQGETNGWHFVKWNSGRLQLSCKFTQNVNYSVALLGGYRQTGEGMRKELPQGLATSIISYSMSVHGGDYCFVADGGVNTTYAYAYPVNSRQRSTDTTLNIIAEARWKE